MKSYQLILLFAIFLFLPNVYAQNKNICTYADQTGINLAIKKYLNTTQAIKYENINVLSTKCFNGFARARLHPKTPTTDDAIVYLKKSNDKWQVLAIGTHFEPKFLVKLPQALRY